MRLVKLYQTADGKTFDSRAEAAQHEMRVEVEKKLTEILRTSIRTGRPEAVVKEIIEEFDAVKAVLGTIKVKKTRTVKAAA